LTKVLLQASALLIEEWIALGDEGRMARGGGEGNSFRHLFLGAH
jgi:hypothetical protein